MQTGLRWLALVGSVLLVACGTEGESSKAKHAVETPTSQEILAIPTAEISPPSSAAGPDFASRQRAVDEAVEAADDASNDPVAERATAWLATGQASDVRRALRLLLRSEMGGVTDEVQRSLIETAVSRLLEWNELALLEGHLTLSERDLPLLERWNAQDPRVIALSDLFTKAKRIQALLDSAARLGAEGQILTSGESAVSQLQSARELDPLNPRVIRALERIELALLDEAMTYASQDKFNEADLILANALRVRGGSAGLQDAAVRVNEMRDHRVAYWRDQIHGALASGDADQAENLLPLLEEISQDERDGERVREGITRVRLYGVYDVGSLIADPLASGGFAPGMVVIPAGTFQMGSARGDRAALSSEFPRHPVAFKKGIAFARTEVTVGQFRAFVDATSYKTQSEKVKRSMIYDERSGSMREKRGVSWRSDAFGLIASDDMPVVHVSWKDAVAYARWLSEETGQIYRLPSEAEFEYALRAGAATVYPWGEGAPQTLVENLTGANDVSPSGRRWSNAFKAYNDGHWGPAPVASFSANAFGLSDMAGNVSEWVADCWHDSYSRAPRNGSAWVNEGCSARVIRGGSWASSPEQVRAAFRIKAETKTTTARVGFRVVREL